MLAFFEGLRNTPAGLAIYDQIRELLSEEEAVQRHTERVYGMLLRLLLESYASDPTLAHVTRVNAKLSELRRAQDPADEATDGGSSSPPAEEAASPEPKPKSEPPKTEPKSKTEEVGLQEVLNELLRGKAAQSAPARNDPAAPPVRTDPAVAPARNDPAAAPVRNDPAPAPVRNDPAAAPVRNDPAPAPANRASRPAEPTPPPSAAESPRPPGREAPSEAPGSPPVERRVNSAYRLHLDRKRDEIAKLQEAFAQNVGEAVAQNREFGALLQIELNALQQAESAQEIENLRQILIGGIEELIQGHRSLELKLRRTSEFLGLIRSDSDRLRDELNKVRLLSLTDEYTGLPNRRAFMRRLQDEIGRAQRYGSPLALALLDLDEFKAINDAHGHAAGDEVLRSYAANVLSILRHHDLVARYGGEEFAVLLPNTSLDGAIAALTKVKNRARSIKCSFNGEALQVPTFSAGLTLYASGDADSTLVDRADRALYRAKRLGRNRIEVELSPASKAENTERAPRSD